MASANVRETAAVLKGMRQWGRTDDWKRRLEYAQTAFEGTFCQ